MTAETSPAPSILIIYLESYILWYQTGSENKDTFQLFSSIFRETKTKGIISLKPLLVVYHFYIVNDTIFVCIEPCKIILFNVSLQQNYSCNTVLFCVRYCYCKHHRNVGGTNKCCHRSYSVLRDVSWEKAVQSSCFYFSFDFSSTRGSPCVECLGL